MADKMLQRTKDTTMMNNLSNNHEEYIENVFHHSIIIFKQSLYIFKLYKTR